MRFGALVVTLAAFATPVLAQNPDAVPLRDKAPGAESTVTRGDPRRTSPGETDSVRVDPNARNRPNGQVAPPARIDTGVGIIAPEKR